MCCEAFSVEKLEQNVHWAQNLRKLTSGEQSRLAELGRAAATRLGEHFGPVRENDGD